MEVRKWFEYDFLHAKKMWETLEPVLREFVTGRARLRVLDIGCWFSPFEKIFEGHASAYLKLDILSRKEIHVLGFGERLPFKENSFDVVMCTQVLEHVNQPFEVVREIRRVLKPQGKVFLSTHGVWKEHNAPSDNWRFAPAGFKELFKGFSAAQIIPQGGSLLALMQLFNLWVSAWRRPSFASPKFWYWLRAPLYVVPNLLGLLDHGENQQFVQNYLVVAKK